MKTCICLLTCILAIPAKSQSPDILFQKNLGSTDNDWLHCIIPTKDEGFILAGNTVSNAGGNKSEDAIGSRDAWIVKMNGRGEIQWENTIGGSGYDHLQNVRQTQDGGYIAAIISGSGVSGDKSQPSFGDMDYWLVKLDAGGNVLWDVTIGSTQDDWLHIAVPTPDGGCLLGGWSFSGIGGLKTDATLGFCDFWVVKTDSVGNIEWQKTLGGSSYDYLRDIIVKENGHSLIAGYSASPAGPYKSEANKGDEDYWILELNEAGDVLWESVAGGSGADLLESIYQDHNGRILVAGRSYSNASFDKSEDSFGDFDYWPVMLDSTGNLIWEKTIGGDGLDMLYDIAQLRDSSYVFSGHSRSGISGNKSTLNQGDFDYWLVGMDEYGNISWQMDIGGSGADNTESICRNRYGEIIIGGYSVSPASGDKTESGWGGYDFWLVKAGQNDCRSYKPHHLYSTPKPDATAQLSWRSNYGDPLSGYEIYYRITGSPLWTIETSSDKMIMLNDLTSGASYEWKVRSVCPFTEDSYAESVLAYFTIPLRQTEPLISHTQLTIYPNPSDGHFAIQIETNMESLPARIIFYDLSGKVVYTETMYLRFGYAAFKTDNPLPTGIYQIEIYTPFNQTTGSLYLTR